MNILILTNHLNIGGITRYVLNLSYGLKKRGHNVSVGSLSGWGEKFLRENSIGFLKLPLKTKSIFSPCLISAYFILKRFIRREDIDLIHAQTRITQFLAFILSKRLNITYVSTFHGFYRPHRMRKKIPCLGDLTIAISQAVGRHLIEDFNLEDKNLRVIYPALLDILTSYQLTSKGRGACLKGNPTLGIIARLSEEKGHLHLFSAFRRLIKDYPQARLLVVGSGKKEKEFRDWVENNGLAGQIIFLGNVPELRPLFKIIDISVLPSSLEGLGFSILEAQANGVPVVASSAGGITEIVKDSETGILVEPGDADGLYRGIKLLLEDTALREEIVNNSRTQVEEKFNLDKMVSLTESVYKEALGKRRRK
jgi:glycosyltransferase involved in cell wall biosynthesis